MTTTFKTGTFEHTERPWGWYDSISEAPGNKVKRICVHPGHRLSLQRHNQRTVDWVVVVGVASITIDEREFDLTPGQHCDIATGQVHRLANRTTQPLEIIEVQLGAYLGEDDIIRLQDDYSRG